MTERSIVFLVSLAIVAATVILIDVVSRIFISRDEVAGYGQIATVTTAYELRQTTDQILANTRQIQKALGHQRRVLNDAHKKISIR